MDPEEAEAPDRGGVVPALRRAARLFDAGSYHEAHELLDEAWEATYGEDDEFLKGLIQACIALHHAQQGNLEGARKLYAGHRRYLGRYLPAHRGLDVAALLADMQRAFDPLLRGAAPSLDPALRPRLRFLPGA